MPLRIESCIMDCGSAEGGPRRPLYQIDSIILHRIGGTAARPATCAPDYPGHNPPHSIGETAVEIAAWFRTHPEAAGTARMPYTFVVRRDGVVEQALWLTVSAPHARRWNTRAIGIAIVGDFRHEVPPSLQVDAVTGLCARLNDTLRRPLAIYGHSMWIPDVAGATKDISKQCPGPLFAAAYKEVRLEVRTAGQVHLGV